MSEIDLYLDEMRTKILEMQDLSLCASLFSSQEFFTRPPVRSHPTVRTCLKDIYEGGVDSYHYLYAGAPVVRERLAIQGYSADRIAAMWEDARSDYVESSSWYLGAEELAVVTSMTYVQWQATVRSKAVWMFEGGDAPLSHRSIELIGDSGPLWDPLAQVALQLDALEPTEASRVFRRLLSVRRSYDERYKEQVFA